MSANGKGSVLLADDDPTLLDLYGQALREAGYEVETAQNGREAINLIWGSSDFDVVLSDIQMPDIDGIALVRTVRERDLDIPVVLMTGAPAIETAVQALEYGAFKYLMKPVSHDELTVAVDGAVRLHRLTRLKREALLEIGGESWRAADPAALSASLNRAILSLSMVYQPIVRAADGSLYGREALARTREASLPHPGAVFEAAERLGRVVELGRAVRRSVAANWPSDPDLAVFVNLHSLELTDEALFSSDGIFGRNAKRTVLEVTERASLDGVPDVRRRVRELRDLGFRIAVDDLGAGYAGLTSFAALEPEVVKLDLALVRGIDGSSVKRRLVASMVDLCRSMSTLVVAEGVETEAERSVLVELGCDLLQGFLLGRPAALGAPPGA
jgi:EAL domain-containing protein (putative c-di-GMP-specific phosphodiesterase class I)